MNSKKKYLFFLVLTLFLFGLNTSQAQVTIFNDNFESGMGNWIDGGYDCARVNNTLINGNYNVRLRDNSGVNSSMTSQLVDLTPYGQIDIRFRFRIVGFEDGEDFFLQYNSGSGFSINLERYIVGDNVENNITYTSNLTMSVEDFILSANSRFRFRCDASQNNDRVFIDNITIIGHLIPPNDECANAISLPVNTSCVATFGTTNGATESSTGCTGTADDDVWYSFVATNTEHTIRVAPSNLNDVVFEAFDGGCGSSLSSCIDNSSGSESETATYTGLTIGNTYHIRVYSFSSDLRRRGRFSICITEPCSPSTANGTSTLACPSVEAGSVGQTDLDPTINCSEGLSVLEADYLDLGDTTDYKVEAIPYNPPFQFNCLANPVSVNIDDRWSDVVNLPFDFCFYGNTYNSCVVGSNGVISFDTSLANTSTGWRITENIPNSDNASGNFYGPSIFGVHQDVDPSKGGEIGWQLITLDSGCQALVAAWSDVPMYNDYSKLYSGMIVFYENTNIIEVYVKNKIIDRTWNNGNAAIAIQSNATEGIAAPGRNSLSADWNAYDEAWRFTPDGTSITELKWYENSVNASNEIIDPDDDGLIVVTPTTTTSYFAEITYTLCDGSTIVEIDEAIVTVEGQKTWNGSQNNDWDNPNNWTPVGIPTPTDCILIPNTGNNPVMSGSTNAVGYNLEIADNASITQVSNSTLVIEDEITIEPNGDLEIQDDASVIQITDVTTNNNSGIAKVQRRVTGLDQYDYVYWSSPVENFDVENISPSTPNYAIYKWEPTVANGTVGKHGTWINTNENMVTGKGYIVRGLLGTSIPNTAEFMGTLNNGQISYPISRGGYTGADYAGIGNTATSQDDNWNLIGNPYPSAISLFDFVIANPNIDGTVYLWRHLTSASSFLTNPFYENYTYNYSSSDYIAANILGSVPSGFSGQIASGQGFFVQALDTAPATSNVTFSNTMRGLYANNNFYRSSDTSESNEKHRIWLDLVDENNTAQSILVGYINGASDDIDRLYDGYLNSSSDKQFYSVLSDKKLAINGKPLPFEDSDLIPLGYKTSSAGNFTISINTLDGLFENATQGIYVEDKLLNIIHDLRAQPYSFTTDEGIFNNRFVLRFNTSTLGINEQEILSNVTVRTINKTVKATSTLSAIKTFELFDITGRIIHKNLKVNNDSYLYNTNNLSNGNYIVKVILENGAIVSKKIIL